MAEPDPTRSRSNPDDKTERGEETNRLMAVENQVALLNGQVNEIAKDVRGLSEKFEERSANIVKHQDELRQDIKSMAEKIGKLPDTSTIYTVAGLAVAITAVIVGALMSK